VGLFKRKKQIDLGLPPLADEALVLREGAGHNSPWVRAGRFDLRGFYSEMWEVGLMPSAKALEGLGLDAATFYDGANLELQWDHGDADEHEAALLTAIQYANMLADAEYNDVEVAVMHGMMRAKALGLALACDSTHGTTYLRQLANDPLQFGVHMPEG
jgi:hypothetical protein